LKVRTYNSDDLCVKRRTTCILYLNTVAVGGETSFKWLDLKVQPKQGQLLFFFPSFNVKVPPSLLPVEACRLAVIYSKPWKKLLRDAKEGKDVDPVVIACIKNSYPNFYQKVFPYAKPPNTISGLTSWSSKNIPPPPGSKNLCLWDRNEYPPPPPHDRTDLKYKYFYPPSELYRDTRLYHEALPCQEPKMICQQWIRFPGYANSINKKDKAKQIAAGCSDTVF
jgi:hypothetical protein